MTAKQAQSAQTVVVIKFRKQKLIHSIRATSYDIIILLK